VGKLPGIPHQRAVRALDVAVEEAEVLVFEPAVTRKKRNVEDCGFTAPTGVCI